MSLAVDIKTTIRPGRSGGSVPRLPFERIARDVLGSSYELSLVLCGDRRAKRLNEQYRGKSYYPNVLSFEIEKGEGEIFLNVRCAEREAKKYDTSLAKRIGLLFVHGLFHLKGFDHGKRMEREEQRVLRKFGLL